MPDELLTVFKLCFLALLYLFFFRALRAVWTEVNASAGAPPTGAPVAAGPVPAPSGGRSAKRAARVPEPQAPQAPPETPPAATPEAGPTRLVAVEPPQLVGIEYALSDGLSLGRSDAATIVLDDSYLSGKHAAFALRDGAWVVEDLGSTNGTYLNRTKVDRFARLAVGDRVQAGNVVLEVR